MISNTLLRGKSPELTEPLLQAIDLKLMSLIEPNSSQHIVLMVEVYIVYMHIAVPSDWYYGVVY